MTSTAQTLASEEKRLITKALIKTKGNITEAYKINVPCGLFMTYKTYLTKINTVHNIDVKAIKENFKPKPRDKRLIANIDYEQK
jgi:hypothetical protein